MHTRWQHQGLRLLTAILLLPSTLYFFHGIDAAWHKPPIDISIFLAAGQHFQQTGELYLRSDDMANSYAPGAPVFKFTPAFQLLLLPFTSGETGSLFFGMFRVLVIACLAASMALTYRILDKENDDKTLWQQHALQMLCLLLPLWMPAVLFALHYATVESMIVLLLLLVLYWQATHPLLAGIALAIASTKLYPAFMAIFLLSIGNWRAFASWFAGCAVLAGAAIAVFGLTEHRFFLHDILPVLLHEWPTAEEKNMSMTNFLLRQGMDAAPTLSVFTAVKWSVLATTAWLLRSLNGNRQHCTLVFAILLTTMLLCLPNIWPSYQLLLVFPAILLSQQSGRKIWQRAIIACMIFLLMVDRDWWSQLAEWQVSLLDQQHLAQLQHDVETQGYDFVHRTQFTSSWLLKWCSEFRRLVPLAIWIYLAALMISLRSDSGAHTS